MICHSGIATVITSLASARARATTPAVRTFLTLPWTYTPRYRALSSIARMQPGDHEPVPRFPAFGESTPSWFKTCAIFFKPSPSHRILKIRRMIAAWTSSTTATVKGRPLASEMRSRR